MKLSEHFKLDQLIFSHTAARHGVSNMPGASEIGELRRLCDLILEPLWTATKGKLVISSGFRSKDVNFLVGGSKTSAHMAGRAADLRMFNTPDAEAIKIMSEAAMTMNLPFDQMIDEFGGWLHIAVAKWGEEPRRQRLRARTVNGKTVYSLI